MNLSERPAGITKLIAGRLCLDFVNSVYARVIDMAIEKNNISSDKINDYIDLLAWSEHVGLLTEAEAQTLVREARQYEKEATNVLNRAIELREAIYRICKAIIIKEQPRTYDIDRLNEEIDVAYRHQRLVSIKGSFTWQWDRSKTALDRMLWSIADSAAELLTLGDLTRLRECGGENCGWLFEDTSRNRSRQWCDMQDCGNLAKVRRFRSRKNSSK
ncbi:MAG: ABATE domain-containing protein, partial [Acidobacteriota bacterium]